MKNETLRLVQLRFNGNRYVAVVLEPHLVLLSSYHSVYELALAAIDSGKPIAGLIRDSKTETKLDYNKIYNGRSEWILLPAFDVPDNPFMCLVSGTGLTHKNSALSRQSMHQQGEKPSDSIIMYQWGEKDGHPPAGTIGVQPEWFYKGNGTVLKAHGSSLEVPSFANDGGEEPEVAGIYVIDQQGKPYRIGYTTGNEFSDHVMEKKNYLYLAPSKLRQCAIGPELVINAELKNVAGTVTINRQGKEVWSSAIKSGEENMSHSLENLEYHHFKYAGHRIPYQAHVHFFGADAFSFGSNIQLEDGDGMEVNWHGFGRALRNFVKTSGGQEEKIIINSI